MGKRICALVTVCVLLAVLSGCAGDRRTDVLRIDVFFYDYADAYMTSVRAALKERFDLLGDDVRYGFYDGASDQAIQTQQAETALVRGSRLLLVNIVTTGSDEAAQNIVQSAAEHGVPVIFFNREVSDALVAANENCCFVGTDANEAGRKQGEMVAALLSEPGAVEQYDRNGDGRLSYVMLRGELGNAEAFGRTKYAVQRANELTGGLLVPSAANAYDPTQEADGISPYYLYGNWSAELAKNLMDTALITYSLDAGDIELVLANNDEQALGAIEALQERGYNCGDPERTIPVFGVDATETARNAVDAGTMAGTVRQDSGAMAECLVRLSENVRAGRGLTDGLEDYERDADVAKIRIPYGTYTAAGIDGTTDADEAPEEQGEEKSPGKPAGRARDGQDVLPGTGAYAAQARMDALPCSGSSKRTAERRRGGTKGNVRLKPAGWQEETQT